MNRRIVNLQPAVSRVNNNFKSYEADEKKSEIITYQESDLFHIFQVVLLKTKHASDCSC